MESKVPNLDCMTVEDLKAFKEKHRGGRNSKQLFDSKVVFDHRDKTQDLWRYAHNKLCAMQCRAAGNIVTAVCYEDICDQLYSSFTKDMRW